MNSCTPHQLSNKRTTFIGTSYKFEEFIINKTIFKLLILIYTVNIDKIFQYLL